MILIENGYVQDGLKALIYLIPLVYLIIRKKQLNLKYFGLFITGFGLLFFGNFLDFLDEFEFLRNLNLPENAGLWQDFFEDIVGFTLGYAILLIAIYKEWKQKSSNA